MTASELKMDQAFLSTKTVAQLRNVFEICSIGGNYRRTSLIEQLSATTNNKKKPSKKKKQRYRYNKEEWIKQLLKSPNKTQLFAATIFRDPHKLSNGQFLASLNDHIQQQQQRNHRKITINKYLATAKHKLSYGFVHVHSHDISQIFLCDLIHQYGFNENVVVVLDLDDTIFATSVYCNKPHVANVFIPDIIKAVQSLLMALSSYTIYVVTNGSKEWLQMIYAEYPEYRTLFDQYVSMVISARDLNDGEYGEEAVSWKYDTMNRIIKATKDVAVFISIGDSNIDSLMALQAITKHGLLNKSLIIKLKNDPSIADMIKQLSFITELIINDNFRIPYVYNLEKYLIDDIKTHQDLFRNYGKRAIERIGDLWSNTNIGQLVKGRGVIMKYKMFNMLRPGTYVKIDGMIYLLKEMVKNQDKTKKQQKKQFNGIVRVRNIKNKELVQIDLNGKMVNVLISHEHFVEYLCELFMCCKYCGNGPYATLTRKNDHIFDFHEKLKIIL